MHLRKQNQTAHPLPFLMIDSTDHVSGKTGLSPTVTISKDGAAFASPAGAVTEIANGWYKVAASATDANTLGSLIVHATATGADPSDAEFQVVGFDPDSATNLGLSALPTNTVNTSGGLITQGNGAGQQFLDGSGGILVSGYQPIASPLTHSGQAQAGTATTITLSAAGASATDSIYVGQTIRLHTNTGAGQARVITGYVGSTKVATVDRAWQTNPSSTTLYTIFATATGELLDRADGVETGWTLRQVLRVMSAVDCGLSTNNGNTFNDLNNTKARITATVDSNGNRTAITRDAT